MEFLTSDIALTVLGAVFTAAWTWFKGTEYWDRLKRRRYYAAIEALEAGVERTYSTYVREIKAASADGKLTDIEREVAQKAAVRAAVRFGQQRGIDVIATIGEEYLSLYIAKLVRRAKREAYRPIGLAEAVRQTIGPPESWDTPDPDGE